MKDPNRSPLRAHPRATGVHHRATRVEELQTSKRPPDASKRPPRRPKIPPRRSKMSSRRPKTSLGRSKRPSRAAKTAKMTPKTPPRHDFEGFWVASKPTSCQKWQKAFWYWKSFYFFNKLSSLGPKNDPNSIKNHSKIES